VTVSALRRAVAVVGARLRGDAEGERALRGDCRGCSELIEGLAELAELAVGVMAQQDRVTPDQAAEATQVWLRTILAEGGD
jgi:hypothetical protein